MKPTTKRLLTVGGCIAAAHFILTMGCTLITMRETMRRFDEGGPERSALFAVIDFSGGF